MLNKKLENIKKSGKVVKEILQKLEKKVKIGVTGKDLEKIAKKIMDENNVFSSSFNYQGFPGYICVSISKTNQGKSELTHGIPTNIPFEKGDLVSIDVSCFCKDENETPYHADAAITVIVEESDNQIKNNLINTTRNCLYYVISQIRPNQTDTKDIGTMIQNYVKSRGFYTIKEYGGHHIGNKLHEKPFIPNHRNVKKGEIIKKGAFICIEPLVQIGDDKISLNAENDAKWEVVVSTNNFLNAHFEHTLYIDEKEAIILT